MHRTMISRSQGDKLELGLPLCNLFNHTRGIPRQQLLCEPLLFTPKMQVVCAGFAVRAATGPNSRSRRALLQVSKTGKKELDVSPDSSWLLGWCRRGGEGGVHLTSRKRLPGLFKVSLRPGFLECLDRHRDIFSGHVGLSSGLVKHT